MPHLGGFIIHISNNEKDEAIKMLRKEGITDITEVNTRDPKYSSSYDIYGAWRIINGLMERGYINKETHNFTLTPKKKEVKKLFCI